jgi:NAD(P)-dependent dehydrogenase (short-subunit alcohol dehydrogenase family)
MNKKSILISGTSTGIGLATALQLASEGYRVYAGVRKEGDFEQFLKMNNPDLIPVILDVTSESSIDAIFERLSKELDGEGLFGLINNAGINYVKPFELTKTEETRSMMEVNVFGLINLSQKFLPLLQQFKSKNDKNSHILNVGSILSLVGFPWQSMYPMSKFAVYGLTKSMAIELKPLGINVSCVMPGSIATEFGNKTFDESNEVLKTITGNNEKYYKAGITKYAQTLKQFENQASKPEVVAKAMSRILRKNNPKVKNLVGVDAKILGFIEKYLPEWVAVSFVKSILIPKEE